MKTLECEDERGLTSSGRQARPCSSGHTRQQCKGTTCVTAGPASALRAAVSVLFTLCPRCLTAVICSRLITYKYVHQIMIQNMFLGKKNCFDGFCKVGGEKEEGRGKIERERKNLLPVDSRPKYLQEPCGVRSKAKSWHVIMSSSWMPGPQREEAGARSRRWVSNPRHTAMRWKQSDS